MVKNTQTFYSKDEEYLPVGFADGLCMKFEYKSHTGRYSIVEKIKLLKKNKGGQKIIINFNDYLLLGWCFKALENGVFKCDSDDKCIEIIKPSSSKISRTKKKRQYYPLLVLHELGHAKFPPKHKIEALKRNTPERIEFELEAWSFALQKIKPYRKLLNYEKDAVCEYIVDHINSYPNLETDSDPFLALVQRVKELVKKYF